MIVVLYFLIQLLPLHFQFLWCTFQLRFIMGTRHFQKVVVRMKWFVPNNLSFDIQLIQGCENISSLVSLSKSKFFTRAAIVSHSCYSCLTRVACVWHWCYKIDQIVYGGAYSPSLIFTCKSKMYSNPEAATGGVFC